MPSTVINKSIYLHVQSHVIYASLVTVSCCKWVM